MTLTGLIIEEVGSIATWTLVSLWLMTYVKLVLFCWKRTQYMKVPLSSFKTCIYAALKNTCYTLKRLNSILERMVYHMLYHCPSFSKISPEMIRVYGIRPDYYTQLYHTHALLHDGEDVSHITQIICSQAQHSMNIT